MRYIVAILTGISALVASSLVPVAWYGKYLTSSSSGHHAAEKAYEYSGPWLYRFPYTDFHSELQTRIYYDRSKWWGRQEYMGKAWQADAGVYVYGQLRSRYGWPFRYIEFTAEQYQDEFTESFRISVVDVFVGLVTYCSPLVLLAGFSSGRRLKRPRLGSH